MKTKCIGNRSPFTRKRYNGRHYGDTPNLDTDISFVSSGRRSTDRLIPSMNLDTGISNSRLSYSSDIDANFSFESAPFPRKSVEMSSPLELSSFSFESDKQSSSSSQTAVRKFGSAVEICLFGLRKHFSYVLLVTKKNLILFSLCLVKTGFLFLLCKSLKMEKKEGKVSSIFVVIYKTRFSHAFVCSGLLEHVITVPALIKELKRIP